MALIDQYQAYLQDLGNIGARYEASRRFYFALLSGLFVLLSLAGPDGPMSYLQTETIWVVCIAGWALCAVWIIHMLSYGAMFRAKFNVLRAMEKQPGFFQAFDQELGDLKKDWRYFRSTWIDAAPPALFAGLIVALALIYQAGPPTSP